MPTFSERSKANLATCDKRLQDVLNEVIKTYDITVLCGHRNEEDQNKDYDNGFSLVKFPNSKHNVLPSIAVDVAPYPINFDDKNRFYFMAGYIIGIASTMGIKLKWGGAWRTFTDLPHFEVINGV